MRVVIEREEFERAGDLMKRVVPRESVTPIQILRCVRLTAADGALTFTGTDMDRRAEITVAADVQTGGSIAVNAEALTGIIPLGAVEIEADKVAAVRTGRSVSKLPLAPENEFPGAWDIEGESVEIERGPFVAALKTVAVSAHDPGNRVWMDGICLQNDGESGLAVATNAHMVFAERLSFMWPGETAILPKEAVPLLALLDGDTITLTNGPAGIRLAGTSVNITSRLIDSVFSDWRRVVPHGPPDCSIRLSRDELASAVLRSRAFAGGVVHFRANGKALTVAAQSEAGRFEDEIDAVTDGDPLDTAISVSYLSTILNSLHCDEVVLQMRRNDLPLLVGGQDDSLRLIATMRVNFPEGAT